MSISGIHFFFHSINAITHSYCGGIQFQLPSAYLVLRIIGVENLSRL
jgi:hypothetical protein